MSYRAQLIAHGLLQFHELQRDQVAGQALLNRIVRLIEEPWDAWLMSSEDGQPPFRQTAFGEHHEGLISFYVDDDAEILYIFNLVWAG